MSRMSYRVFNAEALRKHGPDRARPLCRARYFETAMVAAARESLKYGPMVLQRLRPEQYEPGSWRDEWSTVVTVYPSGRIVRTWE